MKHDPITEEIHQVRQKLLAECNGNLDELLHRFQKAELLDGDRVVSLEAVRERRRREQNPHLTLALHLTAISLRFIAAGERQR